MLSGALAVGLAGAWHPVLAQCGPDDEATARPVGEQIPGSPSTGASDGSGRRWWNLWSETSPEDRLIWGMWTTHLNRENDGWQNDRILAVVWEGWYVASFRTTHGPRAYTVGVERSWAAGPVGMVGFRSGLVYGYDGRLGWLAEAVPVLPFAQPVLYTRLGPFTTDVTYTWVVISVTAGLRF